MCRRWIKLAAGLVLTGWIIGATQGCSAPRVNTTRLMAADLVAMSRKMAHSLLNSPALAGRGPDSPRWVVVMDRAVNLTNTIIPKREKWAFVARLRALLNQSPVLRHSHITFILSRPKAESLAGQEGLPPEGAEASDGEMGGRLTPTHALSATFYAMTNVSRWGRSDTYLAAFQLIDLSSGLIVWEDKYEVKRAVVRNKFD